MEAPEGWTRETGRTPGAPRSPLRLPFATYALLLAQVAAWIVVRRFLTAGGEWTDVALRPGTPSEVGFLVSPFVHLEPAHLGVNLAVLWLFGTNLERACGSLPFLLLYLGAGWFGSLMHWATATSFHLQTDLDAPSAAIGSSGAIAGVLAASIVRFPQPRLRLPFTGATFPAAPILVLWLVYTAVRALVTTIYGVTEGIGHWAHLAGFIFGLGAAQAAGFQRAARAEFLEAAARAATAAGQPAAAAQAWSALLALRPADAQVRAALIASRQALGDLPGARRLAREGIEIPVRGGDRPAAIRAYRDLVAQVPDVDLPPGIRYRAGCWLADAGEHEIAFRALCDSVREDGATAGGALYRAGEIARDRLRSPEQARAAWERLLDQCPDSSWCDRAREGLRRLPS